MRSLFLSASILIITLYIPFFCITYFTPWYSLNTSSATLDYIGRDSVSTAHQNLTQFFSHREHLSETLWSKSEKIHMNDVRKIYDTNLAIFFIALTSLIFLWKKNVVQYALKINIVLPLLLLTVIPFFSYFWSTIFHNILFSNEFWITTPQDLSFYLFPLSFFIKSLLAISLSASLINLILYTKLRRKDNL